MRFFRPKHQKLILQCYPSGRGSDKKPNSSELSYLLYYASTRRVKLEKVGRFLCRKNESDVYHNRTGNVQVTLEIINSLIKKCPDDLNVFAGYINSILLATLNTKDLSLCQHAQPVFDTYCQTLDGELFTGDLDFVHNFVQLSEAFLNLGVDVSEANTIEWKAISLRAAGSLAHCKNVNQSKNLLSVVKAAVALICSEIQTDLTEGSLLKRSQSHSSETQQWPDGRPFDLARSSTARTSNVRKEDFNNETPEEIQLDDIAVDSLRCFFSTTSSIKLTSGTGGLADYLIKAEISPGWSAALIEMIIKWVPVQLRFIVLSIFSFRLDKNGNDAEQAIYIHSISSLLSSSVNLVGLPVVDNLKQFINLQKHYILHSPQYNPLIEEYSTAIESLATHIYYQDQIIDLVGEILLRVKETNKPELILEYLTDIKKVLIRSYKSKSVQRAIVPLQLYADTFYLLTHEDPKIQSSYLDLLVWELNTEYKEKPQYLKADYDNLISSSNGSVLNLFYEQLELLKEIHAPSKLLSLLELINEKFGINSAVNFIPFFFQWQLCESDTGEYLKQSILIDNIAYSNLYNTAKFNGFEDLLKETLARIKYRKDRTLWQFEKFPEELWTISVPSSSNLAFSKDEFATLLNNNNLKDYLEIILSNHYKYKLPITADNEFDGTEIEEADQSGVSAHQTSFAMFLNASTPTSVNGANESHSIRSMPLSARSIMVNGKLHIPKAQELRKALTGVNSKKRVATGATSTQQTDINTLLDGLDFATDLEDRGKLTTD